MHSGSRLTGLMAGPLDTKFLPQDVQAKGSPCEAVDLFEDAMPAVTWARQDGNQSVHRAGIIDDLFGLVIHCAKVSQCRTADD